MSESELRSPSAEYDAAKVYWGGVSASVDGMLGGLVELSSPDVADSRQFIRKLIRKPVESSVGLLSYHPSADRFPFNDSVSEVGFYQNANTGLSARRFIDT
ncbi:unnamed protein product [Soboliphyme baturini]|uniref:Beta-lactamase domain-containing protein n=1 Tax=Soboliphyme baturini TaxID=241478 RepID=A0A183IJX7_9BILA|nr:unnamed protein product [Soboliphyme baturini]